MLDIKYRTNKVGLVPYRWRSRPGGEYLQFLVHLPRPKLPGEEDRMKWGVSRGTVKYRNEQGIWVDVHAPHHLHQLPLDSIEDHWRAACQEAEEELGIQKDWIARETMLDHGLLDYEPENREPYSIHFYSVQLIQDVTLDMLVQKARDSMEIGWKTFEDLAHMASSGSNMNQRFKHGYLYILSVISQDLHKLR